MPREGYKTVTVPTELHEKLTKKAEEKECSVPKLIHDLLELLKKSPREAT